MAMNVPGAARQVFEDRGEQLDASQILLVGGSIAAGQTYNNQLYGQSMATDTITATPAATQGTALLLTTPLNRITTAAAGSGVLLPPAIRGMEVVIDNNGANATQVFGSGTDTINGTAGATGVALAVDTVGPTIYFCFSNGAWRTK
jgi:hypothetical protein